MPGGGTLRTWTPLQEQSQGVKEPGLSQERQSRPHTQPPPPPTPHLMLKTALRHKQKCLEMEMESAGFGAGCPRVDMAAALTSFNLMNLSLLSHERERKPRSELLRSDERKPVRDGVKGTHLGTKYKCFGDEDSCEA